MVLNAALSLAAPCFSIHRLAKKPIVVAVVVDRSIVNECCAAGCNLIIQVVESKSEVEVVCADKRLAILGNLGRTPIFQNILANW